MDYRQPAHHTRVYPDGPISEIIKATAIICLKDYLPDSRDASPMAEMPDSGSCFGQAATGMMSSSMTFPFQRIVTKLPI